MTGGGRRLPLAEVGRLTEAEPLFERIAIVGLGLLGVSLGLAARQVWPKALVIGVDSNDVIERAVRRHAIDLGADDLVIAAEADLVVLAAPAAANLAWLAELPEYVKGDCAVTDMGAKKTAIVDAARVLPSRLPFIGGDPIVYRDWLSGDAPGHIESARADVFAGRFWMLSPVSEGQSSLTRLSQFVRGVGAIPVELPAERHDELAPYLDHLREWSGL